LLKEPEAERCADQRGGSCQDVVGGQEVSAENLPPRDARDQEDEAVGEVEAVGQVAQIHECTSSRAGGLQVLAENGDRDAEYAQDRHPKRIWRQIVERDEEGESRRCAKKGGDLQLDEPLARHVLPDQAERHPGNEVEDDRVTPYLEWPGHSFVREDDQDQQGRHEDEKAARFLEHQRKGEQGVEHHLEVQRPALLQNRPVFPFKVEVGQEQKRVQNG
jgi:hypothetical protein